MQRKRFKSTQKQQQTEHRQQDKISLWLDMLTKETVKTKPSPSVATVDPWLCRLHQLMQITITSVTEKIFVVAQSRFYYLHHCLKS